MDSYEKSLQTLELPAVLALLAAQAVSETARTQAMALRPSGDRAVVATRLGETSAAASMMVVKGSPSFSGVKDVRAALQRADMGGALNTRELLDIAGVLQAARCVRSYGTGERQDKTSIDYLFSALQANRFLEEKIFTSITGEDEIADSASSELASIRRLIRAASARVHDALQKIISSPSYAKALQEPIITMRSERYVVPVKAEHKGAVPGLVHDVSASGATLFIEPMAAVKANNELRELRAREKTEIERILAELSAECAAHREDISSDFDVLVRLDLIFAKAKLAYQLDAIAPELTDKHLQLRRARHPLLPKDTAVPIDVSLGGEFDTLVITGPNTGGKTVTLKTIGLLAAMTQCGLHIPCADGSTMPVFHEIMADIGDEQSIEQSLSTFSAHMTNTVRMLKECDDRSLLLFDELGAGTDPAEGAALAVSILERLRKQGTLLMATTHYAELKIYALETPGVVNASCEFDVESLAPTYKLSVGVPGKSNAFLISAKLGIPESVIDAARNHMSNDDKRLDSVLAQLDDLKLQLKAAEDEAEKARYEAEHALESAEKKRDALIKQGEEELEATRRKAHELMQNVQNQAYALTDELRRIQKDEKTNAAARAVRAREIARKDTEQLLNRTEKKQPKRQFVPLKEVKPGQEVVIAELDQHAVVLSRPDKNGMVEVRAGILKTKLPLTGLCAPDKMDKRTQKQEPPRTRTHVELNHDRKSSMELNLLGYTVEEALAEVDRFLDHAMLSNQNTVYIIHGNGTGALRNAIQKHLRTHRGVKSFRLGRYGEGESGVTVVELK